MFLLEVIASVSSLIKLHCI